MSKRQRITYPTGQAQSVASEKYHVGSIVFLPFYITAEENDFFEVRSSHNEIQTVEGGNVYLDIPKEILP